MARRHAQQPRSGSLAVGTGGLIGAAAGASTSVLAKTRTSVHRLIGSGGPASARIAHPPGPTRCIVMMAALPAMSGWTARPAAMLRDMTQEREACICFEHLDSLSVQICAEATRAACERTPFLAREGCGGHIAPIATCLPLGAVHGDVFPPKPKPSIKARLLYATVAVSTLAIFHSKKLLTDS